MSTTTTTTLPTTTMNRTNGTNGFRRTSSSTSTSSSGISRTVQFIPALPASGEHITRSRNRLTTTAVSFGGQNILHTQLQYHQSLASSSATDDAAEGRKSIILLRLNNVAPTSLSSSLSVTDVIRPLWNSLYPYVAECANPLVGKGGSEGMKEIEVELPLPSSVLHHALMALGAKELHPTYLLTRSAMLQSFPLPPSSSTSITYPEMSSSNDNSQLVRPPKPLAGETIYSRFVPHLSSFFSLRTITPSQISPGSTTSSSSDVSTLNTWMNNPRVSKFWMEDGPLSATAELVARGSQDPHSIGVIGSWKDVKVDDEGKMEVGEERDATYAEIYWVKEDKLGGLLMDKETTTVQDYEKSDNSFDRGIHVLVGSEDHRGAHRVAAWLPSLVHYCFLSDPRTRRVVCEPNKMNDHMINYFKSVGFEEKGEVTFPHKVSKYLVVEKTRFYEGCFI